MREAMAVGGLRVAMRGGWHRYGRSWGRGSGSVGNDGGGGAEAAGRAKMGLSGRVLVGEAAWAMMVRWGGRLCA